MTAYPVDSFAPERSIGYLVKRAHFDAAALLETQLLDSGLTYTQFSALVSVVFGTGRTCAALSRELGHDMGATSRIIGVLEERGLVTRSRDAGDRRVFNLDVTEQGGSMALEAKARLVDQWNAWLADWSPREVETLIAGLQKLHRTLADARGVAA